MYTSTTLSKRTPPINIASMADVSLICIIFFLLITNLYPDKGVERRLPPYIEDHYLLYSKINMRNVLVVNINYKNELLMGREYADISQLRERVKEFMDVKNWDDSHPEKVYREFPQLGQIVVNKTAVVSLQNDRGTSYKEYIKVQNEITAAINELRDEFCLEKFGKTFARCSKTQRDVVAHDVYPMAVSEAEPKENSSKRRTGNSK